MTLGSLFIEKAEYLKKIFTEELICLPTTRINFFQLVYLFSQIFFLSVSTTNVSYLIEADSLGKLFHRNKKDGDKELETKRR